MTADLPLNLQWIFCVALATILFMIVGITRVMQEEEEDRSYIRPVSRLLLVISVLILIIPLSGLHLNTLLFLSILSVILFVPVIIGVKSWVQYKFFSAK